MQIEARETLRMAIDSVWSHKLRSGLTILGIVIGITTVVTVAALMSGLNQQMLDFFKQFGPNSIFISRVSGNPSGQGASPKERRRPQFRPEYADEVRQMVQAIGDMGSTVYIQPTNNQLITAKVPGFESDNVNLDGQTPNIPASISPRNVAQGRLFTPEENTRRMRVVVLGADLANALFPANDAVGRSVIIDGTEFTVVGVFEKAKGGFFGENEMDYEAMIPYLTARRAASRGQNVSVHGRGKTGHARRCGCGDTGCHAQNPACA